MTNQSSLLLSLVWCVLGYLFLGKGETAFAIFSSMAALMTLRFARLS